MMMLSGDTTTTTDAASSRIGRFRDAFTAAAVSSSNNDDECGRVRAVVEHIRDNGGVRSARSAEAAALAGSTVAAFVRSTGLRSLAEFTALSRDEVLRLYASFRKQQQRTGGEGDVRHG